MPKLLKHPWLWTIGGMAVYLAAIPQLLGRPLLIDELPFAGDALKPVYGSYGGAWHTPLYAELMRWSARTFGWQDQALRWLGVGCFLVTWVLTIWLGERLRRGAGWLAGWLWATHPLALQGSVLLDIDNTVLTPLLTVTVGVVMAWRFPLSWRQQFLLLGLFVLCLWAKATTPWALIPTLFGLAWLQGKPRAGLATAGWLAVCGTGCLMLLWWWYTATYGIPFWGFLERPAKVVSLGLQGVTLTGMTELANRALRVGLWLTPPLLGLWLWTWIAGWGSRKLEAQAGLFEGCLVYGAIVFLGYLAIGGTIHGFARYHVPLLPIMAATASAVWQAHRPAISTRAWGGIGAAGLLAAAAFWSLGDLLYLVNHALRIAFLTSPEHVPGIGGQAALRLAGVATVILTLWVWVRWMHQRGWVSGSLRGATGLSLIVASVAYQGAVDVRKWTASYTTTYQYGRSLDGMTNAAETLHRIAREFPGDAIVAPEDLLFLAYLPARYSSHEYGQHLEDLLEVLRDHRVRVFMYGPSFNNSYFYRVLLRHPDVQRLLTTQFEPRPVDEYTLWLRRSTVS